MGLLDRISMLVRSNVNEVLDRAENPEKTLDQIIRDMADAMQKAKSQVAETIAQKNLLESNYENATFPRSSTSRVIVPIPASGFSSRNRARGATTIVSMARRVVAAASSGWRRSQAA